MRSRERRAAGRQLERAAGLAWTKVVGGIRGRETPLASAAAPFTLNIISRGVHSSSRLPSSWSLPP